MNTKLAEHKIDKLQYSDYIQNGGTAIMSGTQYFDQFILQGGATLFVTPYDGSAGSGELHIYANSITIDSGSGIDGVARGFRGSEGPGRGTDGTGSNSPGGAGYGGTGGASGKAGGTCWECIGATYGTANGTDIDKGSGGGRSFYTESYGGKGGALIRLEAPNITIQGYVNVNGGKGDAGTGGGGGGSGGGILLNGNNLNLTSSSITARGGDGGDKSGGGDFVAAGAGGGGGRIKIFGTTQIKIADAAISAPGGAVGSGFFNSGPQPGQAGTIYYAVNPVIFNTNPQGARIFLDGNDTGQTTPITMQLQVGTYNYLLRLACYEDITGQFTVTDPSITTIDKIFLINTGNISISSTPSANLYLNAISKGMTPYSTTCQPEGIYQYVLILTNYQSYRGSLIVTRGQTASASATLQPLGPTGTGSLHISATPDAYVYLDGILQGLSPITITNIPIGSHRITLRLDGYYTLDILNVIVEENVTKDIPYTLTSSTQTPTVGEGCISFGGTPQGAHIIIDGTDMGQVTPAIICGLSLGSHTYELSLEGYQSITGSTILGTGVGNNISADLVQNGSVTFKTIPSGAEIWLAPTGQTLIDQGVTTSPTGTTVTDLIPGTYEYKLTLTGYQDTTGGFTVISGQNTVLPPMTMSLLPGGVTVTSAPSGASIYIDDISWGTTPNTIMGYYPGTHNYRLTLEAYIDAIGTFEIISDQIVSLDITLELVTGGADFISTPPGAEIWIDDEDTGYTTPSTIANIVPGSYTYKLTLDGYNDKTGSFDIIDGNITNITESLIPLVTIDSIPTGASVYIDDNPTPIGTTPITISNLAEGHHTYILTLSGYNDVTGSFDIVAGQSISPISETLIQIPVQAGFGGAGMILIAGLAIGAIYARSRKPKTETKVK